MGYAFKLPDLGEGLTEGEVARWLVAEGQEVHEDEPLVEIQTDKTTVEVPSPAAGVVSRILVREGEVVPVGTVLVVIGADAETEVWEPAAAPAPGGVRARVTPGVRRLARELGVDVEALRGSGPDGRITEDDVRTAAASAAAPGERREPLRGVRRLIAENTARANREIPAVTWIEECDFTGVELARVLPLALKAAASALVRFPELNARLENEEIVYLERYDIGFAVHTDQGVVVPVVRGCDTASLHEVAAEVERLAGAAREGRLRPDELRDGTFSVTSAGKAAGLAVTPLIFHPQVAILGIHRIGERPVVRDGEIVVRKMGNVTVTFDHRIVDGLRAAEFGLATIEQLERGS